MFKAEVTTNQGVLEGVVHESSLMIKYYNELLSKPKINNVEIIGDKTSDDYNLVSKEEGKGLSSNDYTNEDKNKLKELSNYDDTSVKKQISKLNETVENQQKEIDLLQTLAIKQTVRGSAITILDSAEYPINQLKILEDNIQSDSIELHLSGGNLIDFENDACFSAIVYNVETGSIRCNKNNGTYSCFTLRSPQVMALVNANKGKTLYLSTKNNINNIAIVLFGKFKNGNWYREVNEPGISISTVIPEDTIEITHIEIRFNVTNNNHVTDTTTIIDNIMFSFVETTFEQRKEKNISIPINEVSQELQIGLSTYYPATYITNSQNVEIEVTYTTDTKLYIDSKLK